MTIRVLLADDHAVLRDGLRMLLEAQSDIEVVASLTNGREVLRHVQALAPGIIVMDVSMPKLNGIETTAMVLRIMPGVKIIMLSAHATLEHIYRAIRAGAHGYLLKESAGWEIVDALRAVNAGQRYLSPAIDSIELDRRIQKGAKAGPLVSLSKREREILQLVVEGLSSIEIGKTIALSPKTVDSYRSRLMQKLGISDMPSLVKFAIQFGITELD